MTTDANNIYDDCEDDAKNIQDDCEDDDEIMINLPPTPITFGAGPCLFVIQESTRRCRVRC